MIKSPKPKKLKRKELLLFLERLELYVSSGLLLDGAIRMIMEGEGKKRRSVFAPILQGLESGATLERSMNAALVLPSAVSSMIGQGERAGKLSAALSFSRQLLEREEDLYKKCVSAMAYPVVIGIFALILTVGLMKGVVPQIIPLLTSLNVKLPVITQIVIGASNAITKYGIYAATGFVAIAWTILYSYRKKKKIRYFIQLLVSHVPIVGSLIRLYTVSIFLRSLGSLVESGIATPSAYKLASSSLFFMPLQSSACRQTENVYRGTKLGAVLSLIPRMPAFVPTLIAAGEMTGSLAVALSRSANIIDRDIEHTLKKLTSLIEPVMMAGMGCVVGGIALSIILPIYDVSKVLQH